MRLYVEATGFEIDGWLEEFVRTSVSFAIWHHSDRLGDVQVWLNREQSSDDEAAIRCELLVDTPEGPASAESRREDLHEAVLEAANRLEVDLYRSLHRRKLPEVQHIAA